MWSAFVSLADYEKAVDTAISDDIELSTPDTAKILSKPVQMSNE
jgi:hypothetical protein